MRNLLIVIALGITTSSCGVVNRVLKIKASEVHLDQSSSFEKREITTETIDQSVTTITEKADTIVDTKEIKGKDEKKIDIGLLKNGLNIIDDGFIKLDQIYDPLDSTLKTSYTLKPQKIPVNFNRKTEIKNNINTKSAEKRDQEEKKKAVNKKSDVLVERKPDYGVIFIWAGLLLLVALFAWLIKSGKLNTLFKHN
jgi:hypothetical protein